jgi:hypothetical protein
MFDLDQAIADWRRRMVAAGIRTPVPLEELESHLRDDIEQQVRSGLDPQQAFEAAVNSLGQADPLTKEFAKESSTRGVIIVNLVVIFIAVCYGSFMMWLNNTITNHAQRLLGLMGIVLTTLIIGSSAFVLLLLHRAFPRERVRRIGFAGMIVAVVGWLGVLACLLLLRTNPCLQCGPSWPPSVPLSQMFVWLFIISNSARVSAKNDLGSAKARSS